jgi:hypothetical protein
LEQRNPVVAGRVLIPQRLSSLDRVPGDQIGEATKVLKRRQAEVAKGIAAMKVEE